ncbi:Coiled-coil domain-containing protein R3HCC1L [Taenia crassiceps]|uniref:Coiled-coil domain-containing protein R3HCC1L n=1 Tax=Taenia crassiceps TaxID=6207 RepID=A0ABR4Q1L6_9CEST
MFTFAEIEPFLGSIIASARAYQVGVLCWTVRRGPRMATRTDSRGSRRPSIEIYVPPSLRDSRLSRQKERALPSHSHVDTKACGEQSPSDLLDTLQRLTLNDDDFVDFGLCIQDEKPKEVVKVPVGASSNYLQGPNLDYDKLRHIIELYDFPADLQTMTLETVLRPFNESGFILKWVDDTHCLAVFSSSLTAEHALRSIKGFLIKARLLEEASLASKWKIAKSPGDWAMPYKKRPPCDSSVASRIISSHLGLPRPKPSPAALQAQKEAKERRERREQNRKAMWVDD